MRQSNEDYQKLVNATLELEALESSALKPGATTQDKFHYVKFLLEQKKTLLAVDVQVAIDLLIDVANSKTALKHQACLILGYLLAIRNPELAEIYLQRIKNHPEFSGKACQLLAYIYQNSRNPEAVKVLAYYDIAEARGGFAEDELHALSWGKHCLDSLKNNYYSAADAVNAELVYEIIRYQYQEQLITAAVYKEKLEEIIKLINPEEKALINVLAKCELHVIEASLLLAKEQEDLKQLKKQLKATRNRADKINLNPDYDKVTKLKAARIASAVGVFLHNQKNQKKSGWDTVIADSASYIESFREASTVIGMVIGTILDAGFRGVYKSDNATNYEEYFNSGLGWLVGQCFGFIGMGLGAVIGVPLATAVYLKHVVLGESNNTVQHAAIVDFVDRVLQSKDEDFKNPDNNQGLLFNNSSTYGRLHLTIACAPGFQLEETGTSATSSAVFSSPFKDRKNLLSVGSVGEWLVPEIVPRMQ
jgi:hypothetical protein